MKNIFAAAVIATASFCTLDVVSTLSANASLTYAGGNSYRATDERGSVHTITREYTDAEGDTLVRVLISGVGEEKYWVNCPTDQISYAHVDARWRYVDHAMMEGYYSDVACRL